MGWEAVLGILVVVRYIVVLSLYVIGLLLVALNELFLSGANKAAIKEKIEDFWLFAAELSTAQKLSEALKARRAGTKKRIPMFIKLFWFLLFIVFCGSVGTTFKQGSSEIRKDMVSSVVFDMTFEITRTYLTVRNSLECLSNDPDCADWVDLAGLEASEDLVRLNDVYIHFVNDLVNNHLLLLKFVYAAQAAASLFILSLPLTVSLFLSFNFTLWILSRITASSLALAIMIAVDLLISLIMPPLILTLIIYIFVFAAVFTTGGLIDYATFDTVSLCKFMIASMELSFTGGALVSNYLVVVNI